MGFKDPLRCGQLPSAMRTEYIREDLATGASLATLETTVAPAAEGGHVQVVLRLFFIAPVSGLHAGRPHWRYPVMEETCQTHSLQLMAVTGWKSPMAAASRRLRRPGTCGSPCSSEMAFRYPQPCMGWSTVTGFYFRAGSRSATAKCLQYTDAVRVTPCSALGWTYGPPIDATVRQLPCDEARRAAAELGRKYPVRHRVLIRLPRRQAVYYELVADNGAGEQDEVPEGLPAPLIIRVEASPVMCADAATPTSLAPVCTPSLTARSCPSGDTWIITVSMSLAARMPAAETRADQAAASTSASSHIP